MRILWGNENAAADIALRWAGNIDPEQSTGIRVLNEDQPDDDIALAFCEYAADDDTILLLHFNEGTGQTTADSSASPTTAYLGISDAVEAEDPTWVTSGAWLGDAHLRFSYADNNVVSVAPVDKFIPLPEFTVDMWVRMDSYDPDWVNSLFTGWGGHRIILRRNDYNQPGLIEFYVLASGWWSEAARFPFSDTGTWHHIAAEYVGSASDGVRLYLDGVLQSTAAAAGEISVLFSEVLIGNYYSGDLTRGWDGAIDEVRWSKVARYGGSAFSPHRFESGSVTAQYALDQPYKLTDIDWAATVGVDYGQVTKIEVCTAAGWITVAEDPAGLAPPISGLQYTVSGPDIVRVTLLPKQDALQSESPVLDWLAVSLEPVYVAKPPFRATGITVRCLGASEVSVRRIVATDASARVIAAEIEQ